MRLFACTLPLFVALVASGAGEDYKRIEAEGLRTSSYEAAEQVLPQLGVVSLPKGTVESMESFWRDFSEQRQEYLDRYDERVLILQNDISTKYRILSKRDKPFGYYATPSQIQAIFEFLSRTGAKKELMSNMFREAYNLADYGRVSEADSSILMLLKPDLVKHAKKGFYHLIRNDKEFPYWRHFITIFKDDFYMIKRRVDGFSNQDLVFVFDSRTMKVKAQALMLSGLDSKFVPNSMLTVDQ